MIKFFQFSKPLLITHHLTLTSHFRVVHGWNFTGLECALHAKWGVTGAFEPPLKRAYLHTYVQMFAAIGGIGNTTTHTHTLIYISAHLGNHISIEFVYKNTTFENLNPVTHIKSKKRPNLVKIM